MTDKSPYDIIAAGRKFQVIDTEDERDLILRTLDTRGEAIHFVTALLHPTEKRK